MTTTPILRKPKCHFETGDDPPHVTFDDAKQDWFNFPWSQYVQTRWEYDAPDEVHVAIGEFVVQLRGHNLKPLLQAIALRQLSSIRAVSAQDCDQERDTFVTEIAFTKVPSGNLSKNKIGTGQLKLL